MSAQHREQGVTLGALAQDILALLLMHPFEAMTLDSILPHLPGAGRHLVSSTLKRLHNLDLISHPQVNGRLSWIVWDRARSIRAVTSGKVSGHGVRTYRVRQIEYVPTEHEVAGGIGASAPPSANAEGAAGTEETDGDQAVYLAQIVPPRYQDPMVNMRPSDWRPCTVRQGALDAMRLPSRMGKELRGRDEPRGYVEQGARP